MQIINMIEPIIRVRVEAIQTLLSLLLVFSLKANLLRMNFLCGEVLINRNS